MLTDVLEYGFMRRALLAGAIVAIVCPAIGVFLIPRRLSLVADALAHLALAGVALALVLDVPPLAGALLVVVAGSIGIERLRTQGGLAGDTSLALFLCGGSAVAIVLISLVRGFNADLFALLFGSIVTVTPLDLAFIVTLALVVVAALTLFYRPLLAVTLNEDLARTSGVRVDALNLMLMVLTALTIVTTIRIVGVLLIGAMIVIPTLTGFVLARSFGQALAVAIAAALAAVVSGLLAAYALSIAAGGAVVLVALLIHIVTTVFARASGDRNEARR